MAAALALESMTHVERDRAYLKMLHSNRDCERDLMKNVEGWEVGTDFAQPLYKTLDEDIQWRAQKRGLYIHFAPWLRDVLQPVAIRPGRHRTRLVELTQNPII